MRPEGDENLADDSSFYVSPRSTRLRIGSSGCTARIWREEIKAWERGEGRKDDALAKRERERATPFERVHALSTLVKQPLKMVLLACMGRNDV